MNSLFLVGQERANIVQNSMCNCELLVDVIDPLCDLKKQANDAGFDLTIASAYRDFSRQLTIWNEKVDGKRPVLDRSGNPVNINELSDLEKIKTILFWSALPGASRHHWGTDFDVYDAGVTSSEKPLQLTQEEYLHGNQREFNRWLTSALGNTSFFRPYQFDNGGVSPEPWHISFQPLAFKFQQRLSTDLLRKALSESEIRLKASLLTHLDEIVSTYVKI